jgi:hypothetical protein
MTNRLASKSPALSALAPADVPLIVSSSCGSGHAKACTLALSWSRMADGANTAGLRLPIVEQRCPVDNLSIRQHPIDLGQQFILADVSGKVGLIGEAPSMS